MTGGSDDAGRAVDTRQLAFVAVAILGLVVAALLFPAPSVDGTGSGPGNATAAPDGDGGDGGGGGDGGDGDGGDGEPGEWVRWLAELIEPSPDRDQPTANDDPRCLISLDRQPEPGATVTVTVVIDGDPAADVPVRFEGERIGRTGADGTVDAGRRDEERRRHETENGSDDERDLSGVDRPSGVVAAAGHGWRLANVTRDTVPLDP